MVFKKSSAIAGRKADDYMVDENYVNRLLEAYNNGCGQPLPHSFVVPVINDLSLTYKRSPDILRSVTENYEQRAFRVSCGRLEVY